MNSEAKKRANRKWYYKNQERAKKNSLRWYYDNKSHVLALMVRRAYGLSPEDIRGMLADQENACAICRDVFSEANPLNIDHNKRMADAGESARSLLCGRCNKCIGLARENPTILMAAAEYLQP